MHGVGLWMSFSSSVKQLSFALLKQLISNWHEISICPQVVCKVAHDIILLDRDFSLCTKKCHVLHKSSLPQAIAIDRSYPGSLYEFIFYVVVVVDVIL